ncbi:hypothetical protein L209DRAFT_332372 [Thermothelomyces heterothallicus CBS 203.75]
MSEQHCRASRRPAYNWETVLADQSGCLARETPKHKLSRPHPFFPLGMVQENHGVMWLLRPNAIAWLTDSTVETVKLARPTRGSRQQKATELNVPYCIRSSPVNCKRNRRARGISWRASAAVWCRLRSYRALRS